MSIALVVLVCGFANAGTVNVAPGLNTLSQAITVAKAGDILVLQRNAGYPNQGTMNVNVPITIQAVDGAGALPVIPVAQNTDGTYAGTTINLFANITLKNLAFNGVQVVNNRSSRIGQCVQMAKNRLRLVVDGCTFVGFGGRTLEAGRDSTVVIVRNCIETGNGRSNRVDNGRFIDLRANFCDTLIVQNNTLLNCADRWFRHMLEDGKVNYMLIDHNTFMNGTGYRPSFQFRNVAYFNFTNNLVINPSILGSTHSGVRKDEVETPTEKNSLYNTICTFNMAGADTMNKSLIMRNNNLWRDPRIDAILGGFDLANKDSVGISPWFDSAFLARIDTNKAMFHEALNFVHAVTIDSILLELQKYVSGAKGYGNSAFIFRSDEYAVGLDMSYGTTAKSYTAADGQLPLGDLNWYPTKKAQWLTAVEDRNASTQPAAYGLSQNYPNPFNPTTVFEYTLPKNGQVKVAVFNMMGQAVKTLVNKNMPAGTHSISWDGTNANGQFVAAGLYMYRLEADQTNITRKMVLVK